jgi:hypothetical protein
MKGNEMQSTMEIEQLQQHADRIRNGDHDKIGPGIPVTMSTALVAGEGVAQGDLMLIVVDAVPRGFKEVSKPEDKDRQLVPGNTEGAKHCLSSLQGVQIYHPPQWTAESLEGPVLVTKAAVTVQHPTHGAVEIPAGMTVGCFYQREFDAEQQRERRAAD